MVFSVALVYVVSAQCCADPLLVSPVLVIYFYNNAADKCVLTNCILL